MAKIAQGVYGGVSGKLGNTVGASWKGIHYLRIMPASVANPNTPKQQDQRSKFLITLKFLQPLYEAVNLGFKDYAVKMSAFNSAFSYTIQNAISGSFPDYGIHYPSVLMSRGKLKKAESPVASSETPGTVEFAWDDNSDSGNALPTDKALIAIFNPAKNEAVVVNNATRAQLGQTVNVPAYFMADDVHCWVAFISDDGLVSDSTYAGVATIA